MAGDTLSVDGGTRTVAGGTRSAGVDIGARSIAPELKSKRLELAMVKSRRVLCGGQIYRDWRVANVVRTALDFPFTSIFPPYCARVFRIAVRDTNVAAGPSYLAEI